MSVDWALRKSAFNTDWRGDPLVGIHFAEQRETPTSNDLGKIRTPGGVPLVLGAARQEISVHAVEMARQRLETVPPADLERWVVELERIIDKKLYDGEDYVTVGEQTWSDGKPKKLGFLAKNGGNPDAPELEFQFDFFQLQCPNLEKSINWDRGGRRGADGLPNGEKVATFPVVEIYRLKYADAEAMVKALTSLFTGQEKCRFVADPRTNALIVLGTREQQEAIRDAVLVLNAYQQYREATKPQGRSYDALAAAAELGIPEDRVAAIEFGGDCPRTPARSSRRQDSAGRA
jgi:hypothetical protein